MPVQALWLVVLAGLIHAVWNIAAKKAGGDLRFSAFLSLVILVVWSPVGLPLALAQVPTWGWQPWAAVVASAAAHTVYFTLLLRGYRLSDLTVVYPLARGSGPLLTAIVAVVWLGELLSPAALAGVAAVVAGVFLIAGGPGIWRRSQEPLQSQRLRVGLFYGLATGACIAAYTVIDGVAVRHLHVAPILVSYMGNLVRLAGMAPVLLRDPAATRVQWRAQWKYALFVGTVSPVSYVLVLYAVQMAPLSHVAPAREVSMLFAALIGGQLLGEGDRGLRLLGAACIAVGVMALALG